MHFNDIKYLSIDNQDLLEAVEKAYQDVFGDGKDHEDNLRQRSPIVRFDNRIRGSLGEILIKKELLNQGIEIISTGTSQDDSTDIDIYFNNKYQSNIRMEIKTSLVPDSWKDLNTVIDKGDIKIIKREGNIEDSKSHVHVQIYFNFYTDKRDEFLNTKDSSQLIDKNTNEIINILKYNDIKAAFMGWIDKTSLIEQLNNLNGTEKVWKFAQRYYWVCPIKTSKSYNQFIREINSLILFDYYKQSI